MGESGVGSLHVVHAWDAHALLSLSLGYPGPLPRFEASRVHILFRRSNVQAHTQIFGSDGDEKRVVNSPITICVPDAMIVHAMTLMHEDSGVEQWLLERLSQCLR